MTVFSLDGGSPLPSGWGYATAGDFRRKRSATFNPAVATDDEYELWSIPSHASGTPEVVAACDIGSNKQHVAPGDVLLSRINPRLNRTWVVWGKRDIAQIASTEWVVFPSHNGIDSQFFAALLSDSRMRDFLAANASGIGGSLTRVRPALFDNIRVPLPPLNEQRRIVDRIEALFDQIDQGIKSLHAAKSAIRLYRQSLLKSAFEGRLTADWRAKNPDKLESYENLIARAEYERDEWYRIAFGKWTEEVEAWQSGGAKGPKPRRPEGNSPAAALTSEEQAVLPRIPKSWVFLRLSDIAAVGSGMSVSKARKPEVPVDVPYLRVANVQRGFLDLGEIKTMPIEMSQAASVGLHRWDVLFNEGGDRDKLGRGWVWDCQIPHCIAQNHVFRASPFRHDLNWSKYISQWGNSFGRDYFERGGKQTTNLASINKTVLKALPVPYCSPGEQTKIVRILDKRLEGADSLQAEIDANLARADALRQSILKKAFSGQLVSQDPDDEPAQALLARIRASRGGDSTTKPRRRARPRASATAPP